MAGFTEEEYEQGQARGGNASGAAGGSGNGVTAPGGAGNGVTAPGGAPGGATGAAAGGAAGGAAGSGAAGVAAGPAKGTTEWADEGSGASGAASGGAAAAKGTKEWAEGNSGENAPQLQPEAEPAKGTREAYEKSLGDAGWTRGSIAEAPEAGSGPRYGNMQDLIDFLEERKAAIHIPTQEELERERKRRRAEGIVSAAADGARALSNLIFTTRYAPDMYRQEDAMSPRMRERYERLKAEREADADRYYNYALTIGRLKDAQDERAYQRGRDALQDEIRMSQETRAQLKADRDAAMAELRMQLMEGKISAQEAAARAKEIEAKYADDYWKAKVDVLHSQKSKNDRWVPGRSGGGSRGGRGATPKKPIYDRKGNVVGYAYTPEEAATESAKRGGKYPGKVTTGTDRYGQPTRTVTTYDVGKPAAY